MFSVFLCMFRLNLLAFSREYHSLIGYASRYLSCCRYKVAWHCLLTNWRLKFILIDKIPAFQQALEHVNSTFTTVQSGI